MAYFNLYRCTKDENLKFVGAGWNIIRIEEFTPEELNRYNIYGNIIHRFIIPSELADKVSVRRGNDSNNWENSENNELELLTNIEGQIPTDVWEIRFAEDFDPGEYYVKQSKPEALNSVGIELGEPVEIPELKILEMGKKVEKMLSQVRM